MNNSTKLCPTYLYFLLITPINVNCIIPEVIGNFPNFYLFDIFPPIYLNDHSIDRIYPTIYHNLLFNWPYLLLNWQFPNCLVNWHLLLMYLLLHPIDPIDHPFAQMQILPVPPIYRVINPSAIPLSISETLPPWVLRTVSALRFSISNAKYFLRATPHNVVVFTQYNYWIYQSQILKRITNFWPTRLM